MKIKKYVDTRPEVLRANKAYLEQKEQGNWREPELDCVTAMLTGAKAMQFLEIVGSDGIQDLLDEIQCDLDEMPRFSCLIVEGKASFGLKYRAIFIKEYEQAEDLAYFRMGLQFF